MPKLKTHKSTAKKVRITKKGKVLRGHAFSNHFLGKKSSSRKRAYTSKLKIKGAAKKNVKRQLGNNQ